MSDKSGQAAPLAARTPPASPTERSKALQRWPFAQSLKGYTRGDLAKDTVTGILITATAIPLGVGFAQAAGLPPIVGLYTSIAPLIIYGLLGSSRHVKLGLDAASAAMIGAVIVPIATVGGVVDQGQLLALAAAIAVLTGVILVVAGLAKAGFLADLLSWPLLIGYQAGIGISVIIGQIPKMLGLRATGDNDLAKLADTIQQLGSTHAPTAALGFAAFAALVGLRAWKPKIPGALVVLVAATIASAVFGFADHGITVIGSLPSGLPAITLPDVAAIGDQFGALFGVAASLALVIASDVVIASRSFAARGHYRVNANTDLAGLGAAEIAAGLTGAVPASASFVRTSIAERAGSRTQLSSVIGGVLMMAVVAWFTGLLAAVPIAVLAAICAETCVHLVDVTALRRLWRLRRMDFTIAVVTGVLVLATDPLVAIGVAVAFSILGIVIRALRPGESRLGRRAGIDGWFMLNTHADARADDPEVVIYAWNAPLMFANAQTFRDRLQAHCRPETKLVIIDCSAMFDVDPSAVTVLEETFAELRAAGISIMLAAPTPQVMALLRAAELPGRLGEGPHVFIDIDTALAAAGRAAAPAGVLVDRDGDGIFEYMQ